MLYNILHLNSKHHRLNSIIAWVANSCQLIFFVALYTLAYPVQFPLWQWYSRARTTFGILTEHNPFAAFGLAGANLCLLILNYQTWQSVHNKPNQSLGRIIWAGWLFVSLCLLFTFPGQSTDMGDYTFRAHMLVHLGKNPLTITPDEILGTSDFPFLAWRYSVDTYGPLWHFIAGGMHALVGEDWLKNLLGFKLIAMWATGISGWLIYSLVSSIAPQRAQASLVLWLWNPLVLNEGVLHGHNEFVAIACVIFGLWLIRRGQVLPGILALILVGLVKITTWLFLLVVYMWLVRKLGKSALYLMIPATLIGSAIIWISYLPFGGWERIPEIAQHRGWWPTCTWTAAIFFALRDQYFFPHELVVQWVIGSATLVFAIVAFILLSRMQKLCVGMWNIQLAYLLIGAHWFMPWYAIGLIALTSLCFKTRLVAYTFLLTWFMLLLPIVAQYFVSQQHLPPGGYDLIMAATSLLIPQIVAIWLVTHKPGNQNIRSWRLLVANRFLCRF